ncbi:MAG: glycine--tRNA ligase subunit beta [Ferrovum sp. 34-44-207]|nr:MAG: glycine--tRNA ligase subunit beta [Ferrovum sp. 34-44-207]
MRSSAITIDQLVVLKDNKGQEVYGFSYTEEGKTLAELLSGIVEKACAQLPVAKMMRWGNSPFHFVRPVHGLVVMYGQSVMPLTWFGLNATNQTRGHRFLCSHPITITHADQYAQQLKDEGWVIAHFEERKKIIAEGLHQLADGLNMVGDDHLINEVTSLVEWPQVLSGHFDEDFLTVPSECLILSMQQHQKYFPLEDNQKRLQPQFLMVSNLHTADPSLIVDGNERVLKARLSDAQFFYQTDLKTPLINRLDHLKQVVYVKSLGSVFERVTRLKELTAFIATSILANALSATTAAELCKADLISDMVGEFPELQGVMGKYYALNDGYSQEIAEAIEDHYRPRFANDGLPRTKEGFALALADKLESLVGLFACGQIPTGDKDPYGLRRASLGVIRLGIEGQLPLSLDQLIHHSAMTFTQVSVSGDTKEKLTQFIIERLKGYLKEQGFTFAEIESVLPFASGRLDLILKRLHAIRAFSELPQSQELAAANKRIKNILKKNHHEISDSAVDHLNDPVEQQLISCLQTVKEKMTLAMEQEDFNLALQHLIPLTEPIHLFFNEVMIMAEDPIIRGQRLSLLNTIYQLMQQVADIGMLDA